MATMPFLRDIMLIIYSGPPAKHTVAPPEPLGGLTANPLDYGGTVYFIRDGA